MKKIFLLSLLCVSVNSFAIQPNTGDLARYNITNGLESQSQEVRELGTYDSSDSTFVLYSSVVGTDGSYEGYAEVSLDFLRREYIEDTTIYCNEAKPLSTLEVLEINAIKILACKVDYGTYVTWVSSDVPFGTLKNMHISKEGKILKETLLVDWINSK